MIPFATSCLVASSGALVHRAAVAFGARAPLSDTLASWGIPKEVGDIGLKVLLALALFLVGWIVARVMRSLIYRGLVKTDLDDKLAEKLGVKKLLEARLKDDPNALERMIATGVYWVLMLFVFVVVLDFSGLEAASAPIHSFLNEVTGALPDVGKALLIFGISWVAAFVLRRVVIAAVGGLGVDRRFGEAALDADAAKADEERPFANGAGQVVYWVLLFLGFAGAVDALHITVISEPLRNAVDKIVGQLPRVGMAAFIFAAGWFLGKAARGIVSNLLDAVGLNRVVARIKFDGLFGTHKASGVLAMVLQFFIVFNAAILALDQLQLTAVSDPLKAMMTEFWLMVPAVLVSALMVFVAVVLGRVLRSFVSAALDNLGLNALAERLGMAQVAERQDALGKPSELVGFMVQVAVVLVATAQAFDNMGLATWRTYVDSMLAFTLEHAVVAMIIVILAFALGNYVRDVVKARDGSNPMLAGMARSLVLIFGVTMALTQLGVAEDFVLMTFGLMLGALCLAAGLAFGLGSKDVAGEVVRERYKEMTRPAPAKPRSATGGLAAPAAPAPKAPTAPLGSKT